MDVAPDLGRRGTLAALYGERRSPEHREAGIMRVRRRAVQQAGCMLRFHNAEAPSDPSQATGNIMYDKSVVTAAHVSNLVNRYSRYWP